MSPSDRKALVQVWGKGFRVTTDSEEFQRLIPADSGEIQLELERHVLEFRDWGRLLESLYEVSRRDLAKEHCVLFRNDHLCAVAIDRSEDRFKRSSLVVLSACVRVSWETDDIGDIVARLVSLSHRLAREYADVFRGAPSKIHAQLRERVFLADRGFALEDEAALETSHWREVIAAVQQWQDVDGVATPRVLPLGGNVLIGTSHEAKLVVRGQLDGRYDVVERRIEPLTDKLKPWPKPAPKPSPRQLVSETADTHPRRERLDSIDESLRNIDQSVRVISDAFVQFLDEARSFWFGRKPPRR